MLTRQPFRGVASVQQCEPALAKLVEHGLSLDDVHTPDTFAAAAKLAATAAGDCTELTLRLTHLWAAETFAQQGARVAHAQRAQRSRNLNFICNMEIGRLVQANDDGRMLLAPLADLMLGTGEFLNAERRSTNTRFHMYLSDLVELADIPAAMRTRLPIVARSVSDWYTRAMWPAELRGTVFAQ